MTMTETEELRWLRVLFIEDNPIECDWPGCPLEAKWRHVCPACGVSRVRCNPSHNVNGVLDPVYLKCGEQFGGCGTVFPTHIWRARYYPI